MNNEKFPLIPNRSWIIWLVISIAEVLLFTITNYLMSGNIFNPFKIWSIGWTIFMIICLIMVIKNSKK